MNQGCFLVGLSAGLFVGMLITMAACTLAQWRDATRRLDSERGGGDGLS